ncbi:polypeptide N-acetylgalactosaminyltransferase 5-like [Lucilia cuprina]|uniref:polypeptide N-acetylgalactosaminyltransferase 5-like n=1 Tax=Lucilia cuprina TaxID=7375 RepID=UPI001F06F15D|nr:polypeptide N-acetylgalactosaminyltransferase 5-like [Lucilia cuprina]
MSSLSLTRKLRGRMRSNTCRIILLTSLVWVIVDFVLIAHYSDCIGKDGWRCKRSGEYDIEVSLKYLNSELHIGTPHNEMGSIKLV